MKEKFIVILLCMLMMASVFPIAHSVKDTKITPIMIKERFSGCLENWSEQQKLLGWDSTSGDNFGWSVSADDDTILVGSPKDNSSKGSVYVFIRDGDTWIPQQKLSASDSTAGDEFGVSVSLDGDTALIGAPYGGSGSAYIFTRSGTTWIQQTKLLASDGAGGDQFGFFVSLDGNTALIGAVADDDLGSTSGSAYVFTYGNDIWSQQQKLLADDGQNGDRFGFTVSLQGDIALIGAIFGDGITTDTGAAYVFIRIGETWIQNQKIFASDGEYWDVFGQSVSLDRNTALVGARFDEAYAGSVYVFTFSGTTWTQQQKLVASDSGVYDSFGIDISIDGNIALIGAEDEISSNSAGAAYIFTRTGTVWTEQAELLPSDGVAWDWFGGRVSLFNTTALIGAAYDDDNGINSGSAYLFQYSNLSLNQPPYTPSNPSPSDGLTDVDIHVPLSWVGGDPNPEDTVTYDVYFGTINPPPKVTSNQSSVEYNPGTMGYSTKYYWRIVAWDNHGSSTNGLFWQFTTMNHENHQPYMGDLSGPSIGDIGVEYCFNGTVFDPDNDTISCIWEWGDGTTSSWQGPFPTGTTTHMLHAYTADGVYDVKVKPKDQHGLEGEWSTPMVIIINQSLTTTFIFGTYTNLSTQDKYIIITAVNIRMITTQPFQFLHDIAGQKITIMKTNLKAVIFPQFIIGIVQILF